MPAYTWDMCASAAVELVTNKLNLWATQTATILSASMTLSILCADTSLLAPLPSSVPND